MAIISQPMRKEQWRLRCVMLAKRYNYNPLRHEIPENYFNGGPAGEWGKTEIAHRFVTLANALLLKWKPGIYRSALWKKGGFDYPWLNRQYDKLHVKRNWKSLPCRRRSSEDHILDALLPPAKKIDEDRVESTDNNTALVRISLQKLREEQWNDKEIDIDVLPFWA